VKFESHKNYAIICVWSICQTTIQPCVNFQLKEQIVPLYGHVCLSYFMCIYHYLENIVSNRFFREMLGYQEDDSSPLITDPLNPEDYTYSILSKLLLKHKTPQT
jgi:hypothetical protein